MSNETLRADARSAFGSVGALLPVSPSAAPLHQQRAGVRALERAGFKACWVNEVVGGKDALVQLALLASASERICFGTCIANIWTRPAQTMHAAATQLAEALPGRFVLGLGVGVAAQAASVERDFGTPVASMRRYLEKMGAPTEPPATGAPYPRLVAGNGPKMLQLSADLADGALPAGASPEFTETARQAVGPDGLLVIFLPAAGDVPALVRRHIDAGADHVVVSVPRGSQFETGIAQLVELAPRLG